MRSDRSTALLELSARDEAEGLGDAPWPPNYAKQAGEPPRVQPSRARRPKTEYEPGRGEAGGPPPEVAAERAAAVAAGDPNAGLPTEWVGSKPTPTGRRKTSIARRRDRPRRVQGRGDGGLRTLEGAPRGHRRVPRAARRAGRRHARPVRGLVSGPGEPHPRAARSCAPFRNRWNPTSTRGPAWTSRRGRRPRQGRAPAARPRSRRRRLASQLRSPTDHDPAEYAFSTTGMMPGRASDPALAAVARRRRLDGRTQAITP